MSAGQREPLASWRVAEDPRAVVVRLARPCRAVSFAPFGGGLRDGVVAIVNHRVGPEERGATEAPAAHLAAIARRLGLDPASTVGLMTGVDPAHARAHEAVGEGASVLALATAGLANALRVGDAATAPTVIPGTINLIVTIDAPLRDEAILEAFALAVEARTLACLEAGATSRASGLPATGTGTDCVVVAAPAPRGAAVPWCGKHTTLGEAIGRAALEASAAAIGGALHAERTG